MSERPSDTSLSGPEADLAAIASVQRLDRYLVELAALTDAGIETIVGLLVAGTVVVGRTVSEEYIATEMDQHILNIVEMGAATSNDPEDWNQTRSDVTGKHAQGVSERLDARQRMIARYGAEYGDAQVPPTKMPEDLARDVIADHNRIVVTLADARVFPPGVREPLNIGVMRIDLRQVGGWWIIPTDPDTRSASFNYPPQR
jgi:hypothetical protein